MWASDDSECLTAAYLKYIQVKTCDGNMFIDPTIPNNNYWSQGSLWRKWLYMCFILSGFESNQGFLFHVVPDSPSLSVLTSCHVFTIKTWIKRYKNKQTRTFFQHLSFNLASTRYVNSTWPFLQKKRPFEPKGGITGTRHVSGIWGICFQAFLGLLIWRLTSIEIDRKREETGRNQEHCGYVSLSVLWLINT